MAPVSLEGIVRLYQPHLAGHAVLHTHCFERKFEDVANVCHTASTSIQGAIIVTKHAACLGQPHMSPRDSNNGIVSSVSMPMLGKVWAGTLPPPQDLVLGPARIHLLMNTCLPTIWVLYTILTSKVLFDLLLATLGVGLTRRLGQRANLRESFHTWHTRRNHGLTERSSFQAMQQKHRKASTLQRDLQSAVLAAPPRGCASRQGIRRRIITLNEQILPEPVILPLPNDPHGARTSLFATMTDTLTSHPRHAIRHGSANEWLGVGDEKQQDDWKSLADPYVKLSHRRCDLLSRVRGRTNRLLWRYSDRALEMFRLQQILRRCHVDSSHLPAPEAEHVDVLHLTRPNRIGKRVAGNEDVQNCQREAPLAIAIRKRKIPLRDSCSNLESSANGKALLPKLGTINTHEQEDKEMIAIPCTNGPMPRVYHTAGQYCIGWPLDFIMPHRPLDRILTHPTFTYARLKRQRRMFMDNITSTQSEFALADSWLRPSRSEKPVPSIHIESFDVNEADTFKNGGLLERDNLHANAESMTVKSWDFAFAPPVARIISGRESQDDKKVVSPNPRPLNGNLTLPLFSRPHEALSTRQFPQRAVSAPPQGVFSAREPTRTISGLQGIGKAKPALQFGLLDSYLPPQRPRATSVDVSSTGRPRITTATTPQSMHVTVEAEHGDIYEIRAYHIQQYLQSQSRVSEASSAVGMFRPELPYFLISPHGLQRISRQYKAPKMATPILSPVQENEESFLSPFALADGSGIWLDSMQQQRRRPLVSVLDLTLLPGSIIGSNPFSHHASPVATPTQGRRISPIIGREEHARRFREYSPSYEIPPLSGRRSYCKLQQNTISTSGSSSARIHLGALQLSPAALQMTGAAEGTVGVSRVRTRNEPNIQLHGRTREHWAIFDEKRTYSSTWGMRTANHWSGGYS